MATWTYDNNCMSWAIQDPSDWFLLPSYRRVPFYKSALKFAEMYNVKPIEKKDMVLGKEYIALRITDDDFHFMRRNATGHWTHKQGPQPVKTISQKRVFAKSWPRAWGNDYVGPIYLFEV